jgi:uncharacterized protein (DUF885 family)
MRKSLIVLLSLVPILGQAAPDEALQKFFKRYMDERFALHPTEATALGDHRFDDKLDDLSPEALERSLKHLKDTRVRLRKEIDPKKLPREAQVDFEIFSHDLETSIWSRENTKPFAENPRVYNEYISDSVFLLLAQSRLPKETNVANAIARMKQIPRIVTAAKQNLKNPPRVVTETATRQNKGSIGFYEKDIFQFVGESPQLPALKAEAARVIPVLKDYQQFLEKEVLPRASGEWRIGKRKFSKKLDYVLDAGMSADEVLKDAEAEFKRVHNDMYVVARQLWSRYFTNEPLPAADTEGRRSTTARVLRAVSKEHGKPEELVADARPTVDPNKKFN